MAGGSAIRAFVFDRLGKTYVVFWHTSGAAKIALNINADKINLFKELGKKNPVKKIKGELILPVGDRQYLEVDAPRDQVIAAFTKARVL